MDYYGGIEAGGTKFVCMVARGPQDIRAELRFPTTANPTETLARAVAFFKQQAQTVNLVVLGVGSFGPVDLEPSSATFGYVTNTAKPGWPNTNIVGLLHAELGIPVVIDTDVNAAAFGEYAWGVNRAIDPLLYLTVGTGIGGGAVCGGKPQHGLTHPEMGHILVPHDRLRDPFPGVCPFHGDCLEGLASGPAMSERWGRTAEMLPDDHPAWGVEANYLAMALVNLILIYSPRRIVLGGGVMQRQALFPLVRAKTQQFLNKYIRMPQLFSDIDQYIVPPVLGNQSGVLGAIALAIAGIDSR
ncbi:MAG: putative fructokinase [Anaerolineae bacterium]|nr:putative fructokinase [Anaerolineae bacterium]